MTVRQLIERYMKLQEQNYETIIIAQVINDLYQISRGRPSREIESKGVGGMKLKCNDGKVRSFSVCRNNLIAFVTKAQCDECGKKFEVYDTDISRSMLEAHVCDKAEEDKNGHE